MARKYLFSPIGNTDPIKYLYDGSMIHIMQILSAGCCISLSV